MKTPTKYELARRQAQAAITQLQAKTDERSLELLGRLTELATLAEASQEHLARAEQRLGQAVPTTLERAQSDLEVATREAANALLRLERMLAQALWRLTDEVPKHEVEKPRSSPSR